MPFLVALLASPRARRIAYIAGAAIVLALVAWATLLAVRSSIRRGQERAVQIDRQDVTVEATKRVLAADREADAKQQQRDEGFRAAQDELKEVIRDNQAPAPAAAGPATSAVLERMRRQQAQGRR